MPFGDVSIPGAGVSTESTTPDTSTQSTDSPDTSGAGGQVHDLSDDTLVRGVPGYNEPVRYGDLAKRLQADYTRKTTEAQRARQQYETEYRTKQGEIAAERSRLETLAATLVQRQTANQSSTTDPLLAELTSAKYIDGPAMGKFINMVQEKGFAPIVKAFEQRDQILQGMYQQVLDLQKTVKTLTAAKGQGDFDTKINRWLSEGGYPSEAATLAKEIYLAYEGDDLDNEFPQIFEARWNQLQNLYRAQDRKRVEDAKRQGVRVPGRGGNGSAGKPIGLKGHEKARDVAATLWDAIQTGEDT